jgi:hypothetical protein
MSSITIYVSKVTSEVFDGWSSQELSNIDQAKSMPDLDGYTLDAIKKAFPYADVELDEGNGISPFRIVESHSPLDDMYGEVQGIINEVYESFDWVCYKEDK